MKKCLLIIVYLIYYNQGFGQNVNFITAGQIIFEKSVNTYPIIKRELNESKLILIEQQRYEQYKKSEPQFKVLESKLSFSNNKLSFSPEFDNRNDLLTANPAVEQINIVYTDLEAGLRISQKTLFGSKFLIKDEVKKIEWKITDEVREISGYLCRRANAIIMDSVYVVAFYTDEILPSGGPESFNGLPGMILGLVLPHESMSWFAKSVIPSTPMEISPPTKGKKLESKDFLNTIEVLNSKSLRPQKLKPILKYLLL